MAEEIPVDLFKWVASALLSFVSLGGSLWLKRINARLDQIERDLSERNQRISILETHVELVRSRLDRIETKLDILIEKKNY